MNSHSLFSRIVAAHTASTRQIAIMLLLLGTMLVAPAASAQDIVGTTTVAQSIGNGSSAYDNYILNVGNGSTGTLLTQQNGLTVISLHDYANITITDSAIVQGNTSSNGGGDYNSGPNVIEFNSYSTVTILQGGVVQQLGSTTNGEAINAHGYGNTIVNNGLIHSAHGTALWFQDTSTSNDMALRNTVTNNGTISTGMGDGYNVFGSSRGSGGPGLVFNNYGTVKGSLLFGNGNDSLLFGPGSIITGNVDGGGGTNNLTLDANINENAQLTGSVKNFESITKIGGGSWAIMGQVPSQGGGGDPTNPPSPINGALDGIKSLTVKDGYLNIVGAAPSFNGSVQIDAPGLLSVQAQSINNASSVNTDGKLVFDQPNDDEYEGKAITGTGSVTKEQDGMLVMSSQSANTYSGGTYILAGGLAVDRDSDLGASTGLIVLGEQTSLGGTNGTLRFDSSFNLASTRAITLRDGGGTIDTNGNTTTISQTIGGTGALTKAGAGTLNLSGSNTYAGGTVVTGGILGINSDASLGASGTHLVLYNSTTLKLNDNIGVTNRTITMTGGPGSSATIDTGAYTGTFTGVIESSNARLIKQGTGTLALYGTNVYQGGTTIAQGTVAINSNDSLGNNSSRLEMYDQTTLRLDANVTMSSRPVILTGGSGTIDTQGNTGYFDTYITGSGQLVKQGSGMLQLYGANNDYQGGTRVAGGTLAINSNNSLGAAGTGLEMNDQTTLRLDTDNMVLNSRPIALVGNAGSTMAINTQGFTGTVDGVISGNGRLVKQGTGILQLYNANNTYQGGTAITQGTVAINSGSSLGSESGNLGMYDGTTLRLDADGISTNRAVALTGNAGSEMTVNTNGNDGTLGGAISGNGTLTKTGGGVLQLYGSSSYTGGTRVKEGTLAIISSTALGSESGALELYDQTTLRLDGNVNMQSRAVILGGNSQSTPTSPMVTINTQGYTGLLNGTVSEATTNTMLEKIGTGTLGLYGNNTYNGGTWAKDGTVAIKAASGLGGGNLQLGDYDTAGGTGTTMGTLRADADVDFSTTSKKIFLNQGGGAINTNGHTVTLGELTLQDGNPGSTGGMDFYKTGTGTLALINDQLYTGHTFIQEGTLQLDAVDPSAPLTNTKGLLNTTQVSIAKGARLEGQGVVGNSKNSGTNPADFTTIINEGTIAPGLDKYHNSFDNRDTHFIPLTLAGNYRALDGAAVEIHTQLVDDRSQHGTLIIDGVIESGSSATAVKVIHEGGNGATTDQGIEIVRLLGSGSTLTQDELRSELRSNFYLASDFTTSTGQRAVVAGAYSYYMEDDNDIVDPAGSNGGLYLRNAKHSDGSIVIHPGTPLYESYSLILGSLSKLPTLEQRVGHRYWIFGGETGSADAYASLDTQRRKVDAAGVWIKAEGALSEFKPQFATNGDAKFDLDFARVNFGGDMPLFHATDGSKLFGGLNMNVGRAKADITSFHGDGDIDTDMFAIGAALTWFGSKGFYADAQARYSNFDSDIKSKTITSTPTLKSGNEGHGYALSLELGQIFDINQTWSLTPQAQLSYTTAKFDSFRDSTNSDIINADKYKSLEGRLGVALNYEKSHCDSAGNIVRNKLYGLANMYHEFEGDATVSVSTVQYKSKFNKTWAGVAIGGSRNWRNDKLSVYGELGARSSTKHFGDEYVLTGELGFRIMF